MIHPRIRFLDIDFDRLEIGEVLAWLGARPADAGFGYVVTPNVDHVVRLEKADRDGEAWAAYRAADLCLCDSRILARLAAMAGVALPVVPGSDLTARLFADLTRPGDTICLIGGDSGMADELRHRHPGIVLTHFVPPMGLLRHPTAMAEAAAFVAEAGARFTLLAVGSPQQEVLAYRIAQAGRATGIGLCIGASIEFITGRKARAPRWMQQGGIEWLHRLLTEPRRLWRRYLVEGPRIFLMVRRWKKGR